MFTFDAPEGFFGGACRVDFTLLRLVHNIRSTLLPRRRSQKRKGRRPFEAESTKAGLHTG